MSADSKFVPRSLTASEYVRELFGPDDNAVTLVRNRSTGHTVQTIAKAEAIASPGFQSWLANQSAAGSDIYVGMNPDQGWRLQPDKGQHKGYPPRLSRPRQKGRRGSRSDTQFTASPAPNFVLDTSPGKHQVVWKVSGFSQDEAESLLHSLANKFGGDLAATDSTRVLRLPGFANRKLPEEFIVQARQESDAVYTPRDFTIEEDSPEAPDTLARTKNVQRTMPSHHKSQSERDWAYAKRALARGDDPEVVIQRIADYRSEDKTDPNYYARHTVEKAMAERNLPPSQSITNSLLRRALTIGSPATSLPCPTSTNFENQEWNQTHH